MPEEDVPQLSTDAPFRSIGNVEADCQAVQTAFARHRRSQLQVNARARLAESRMGSWLPAISLFVTSATLGLTDSS
jgi:hypothetical protein